MPDPRTIIDGDPGTVWVNETGQPAYQLVCALVNTCGVCLQYHLKIARSWPLGLHPGCRCRAVRVAMGRAAPHPFVDYREVAVGMSPPDRARLMGASNFRLWRAGAIDWEDAVTPSRVRPLHQVVALRNLSVREMVEAGVRPDVALRAFEAVRTPEHEAVRLHRRRLIEDLAGAGVHHRAVVQHIAGRIAALTAAVSLRAAPIAASTGPPPLPASPPPLPLPPPLPPPTAEVRRRQADAFRAEASRVAMGGPPRLTGAAARLIASELGASAARGAPAFVAAVSAGLAAGLAYSAAILALYDRYRRDR